MRVLFIGPVPHLGAGCRARIEQYLPYLKAVGIEGRVRPFMTNRMLQIAYQPGRWAEKAWWVLVCGVNRMLDVVRAVRYDAVFIYREAAPLGPPLVEWIIARMGKPIVYDIDDAIHLPSPTTSGGRGWLRGVKCYWKVPAIIRMSRVVVVCNDYLQDYVRTIHDRVVMIPTPVETTYFTPRRDPPVQNVTCEGGVAAKSAVGSVADEAEHDGQPSRPVIGWMGTHSTAVYLEQIVPVLQRLASRHDFELCVIGAGRRFDAPGLRVVQRDWALEHEVGDLQRFDVGVYPLGNHEFDKGKTGYKTVQYLAVGVPAVVSDFGRNREIIRDGENGFLAGSDAEWEEKLEQLLVDRSLRERMALAGRRTVEERFATYVHAPAMIAVLRAAVERRLASASEDGDAREASRLTRDSLRQWSLTP